MSLIGNIRRVGLVQNELDLDRLSLLSHMTVFPCSLCSKVCYVLFSLIGQNQLGRGGLFTGVLNDMYGCIHTNDMLKNRLMYL